MSAGRPGGAGEGPTGYTARHAPSEDGKAVDARFSGLWPAGTPGIGAAGKTGAQEQPPRSLIHPAPSRSGRRPAAKRAKPAAKPKRKKA